MTMNQNFSFLWQLMYLKKLVSRSFHKKALPKSNLKSESAPRFPVNILIYIYLLIVSFKSKLLFLNRSDFRTDQYLLNSPSYYNLQNVVAFEQVNSKQKNVRKLTSEVMQHKDCRIQLSDLTYPSSGFNKYDIILMVITIIIIIMITIMIIKMEILIMNEHKNINNGNMHFVIINNSLISHNT